MTARTLSLALAAVVVAALLGPATVVRPAPAASAYLSRMGYYVYYDDASWQVLQQQIRHFDIVAPYFFHLTPNGTIKALDEREVTVTEFIKAHNKQIVPIIQNESKWDDFSETIETSEKRSKIVDSLVELVEDRGFDGLQIDFEAVNADDQDLLTDFMRKLSSEFRSRGLIVSQAVVARTSDVPSVWGGAYDYEELGRLNDFVSIMAYDYNSSGSTTPGAVAPYWWVDEVLHYATSRIPAAQIYLGVPFYGRDWNIDQGPPAESVTFDQAVDLANRDGATTGYDPDDRAPWIRYEDDEGDQHEVWYENSASLQEKLDLALEYEVGGFSAWRIGQEDPDNWRVIGELETPATPISPVPDSGDVRYFPETGHSLSGIFLDYWSDNGGLERFGFPRTEPFIEYDPQVQGSYLVQYFERARFEHHPEFAGSEHEVLLGHIGRWALARRGIDPWATAVEPVAQPEVAYFPESGHTLGGAFLNYWNENGGLFTFGYPLTEEIVELSEEDGGTYTVQYFERARMELHSDSESGQSLILLGLLGNEMLRERAWLR